MTRFTFVLLVCRAIGVLSAVYLITHVVFAFDEVIWALRVVSPPSLANLPFGTLATALVVPFAGVLVALYANRVACAVVPREVVSQPVPVLTALAIAAVVCGFYCIVCVGNAQLAAIGRWRMSALYASELARGPSDYFRAADSLRGLPPSGAHDLFLAAGFAVCLFVICVAALRTRRGVGPV
jgi:hypothetical protein